MAKSSTVRIISDGPTSHARADSAHLPAALHRPRVTWHTSLAPHSPPFLPPCAQELSSTPVDLWSGARSGPMLRAASSASSTHSWRARRRALRMGRGQAQKLSASCNCCAPISLARSRRRRPRSVRGRQVARGRGGRRGAARGGARAARRAARGPSPVRAPSAPAAASRPHTLPRRARWPRPAAPRSPVDMRACVSVP